MSYISTPEYELAILIPSYNHGGYVVECIQAALQIQVESKEIIIIDDNSSDSSVEVIEGFIRTLEIKDKDKVTFIKKEKNKGVLDSLVQFFNLADSEFVLLLASDDVVVSDGIESLVSRMRGSNLQFIIGGALNCFEDGTESRVYKVNHEKFFNLPKQELLKAIYVNYPSPILSQSSIIRYSALVEIGGWDPDLKTDDYAMFMKLFARFPSKGSDFDFLPEDICVRYRHHEKNSYINTDKQIQDALLTLENLTPYRLRKTAIGNKIASYFKRY